MKPSPESRSRDGDPLRRLKSRLSGPYDKAKVTLRLLTAGCWRDPGIYRDLHSLLTGNKSVPDLRVQGAEARFRRLDFSCPQSGTQLEEIVHEIFVHRIYEGFGARIGNGDVVLDCGANIGLFALYAQSKIGETGRIICVEPVPETYALLIRNLQRNGLVGSARCVPLNLALSDKVETRQFVYSEERSASATGCTERFSIARGSTDSTRSMQISCAPMDAIVFDQLRVRVDFIKLDAEGMENEVLAGGRRTIGSFKPKCAISPHFDARKVIESLLRIRSDYKIRMSNDVIYAW